MLERQLFTQTTSLDAPRFAEPDWSQIARELKKRGVSLQLLWEEYRANHPDDGYGYSAYCQRYRAWSKRLSPAMRQRHVAGEKMFVDYSGLRMAVTDPTTGAETPVEVFVAVLGASNYAYAYVEASWSQSLPDWIGAHVRAFEYFGGVPTTIVSDNLKSAVIRACFHEPTINRSYTDLARHYGTAILPARPYKPKDKAKVESAVLLVQRWIVAKLRNRTFFSLVELNAAIREALAQMNARVSRHLGASRQELFDTVEKPALMPLPPTRHVHADWQKVTVRPDYHIRIQDHFYSVPNRLIGEALWVRITSDTVEAFHRGRRMASHQRASPGDRGTTTVRTHMPPHHRHYADMSIEKLQAKAQAIGPNVATVIDVIVRDKPRPDHGIRAGLGVLQLERGCGAERLDAACARALVLNACSLKSITSILSNRLEDQPVDAAPDAPPHRPRQYPWPQVFSLRKRGNHAHPSHPRRPARIEARRNGRGPGRTDGARRQPPNGPNRMDRPHAGSRKRHPRHTPISDPPARRQAARQHRVFGRRGLYIPQETGPSAVPKPA